MKKIYILSFASILIFACINIKAKDTSNLNAPSTVNQKIQTYYPLYTSIFSNRDSVSIQVFKMDKGWGYDIYIHERKYIHQEYIPAINGNKPFLTKEDALKIAELTKSKIKKKIAPPAISVFEIDSIGIIK